MVDDQVPARRSGKERPTPPDLLALYDEHAPGLLRYLLGVTGRPDWAQDITQEAFLRLMSALSTGERILNHREWLFTCARIILSDRLHERDEDLMAPATAPASCEPVAPAQAEMNEIRRRLLRRASPREREILELHAEGFTFEEMARILGIAPGTVSGMLTRVVRKFRRLFDQEGSR
jgi:RNA polymerase sigma-70 factor, ECF subfamily